MAHEERGCAAPEGGEEGATGRCKEAWMENVGWARQREAVRATRTSTHRQGQTYSFRSKDELLELNVKGKRETISVREECQGY